MESTDPHASSRATDETDEAELGARCARSWNMVVAYLRGQGARDPENLAGDVLLGAVRNIHRFEGEEAAFRSWLLVIAHRRLVDQRRALARRPLEVWDPTRMVQRLDRQVAGDAEDEAIAHLGVRRVLRALDALTPEQRTVVLLNAIGDLSLPEIAEVLGKHPAAVKSLHHRGLAAAARALGRRDDWYRAEAG